MNAKDKIIRLMWGETVGGLHLSAYAQQLRLRAKEKVEMLELLEGMTMAFTPEQTRRARAEIDAWWGRVLQQVVHDDGAENG